MKKVLLAVSMLLILSGKSFAAEAKPMKINIINSERKEVGTATVTPAPNGVLIRVELRENPAGIPPGIHAIHIHETGQCEPPFKTAGGHFNPESKKHGFMNKEGAHVGDLPNIHVTKNTPVVVEFFLSEATINSGKSNLLDSDGSSLVIHAGADDYRTDPAGDSGDRIACGVIARAAPSKAK
jgi:Cu-Zn family superoxide dismutase